PAGQARRRLEPQAPHEARELPELGVRAAREALAPEARLARGPRRVALGRLGALPVLPPERQRLLQRRADPPRGRRGAGRAEEVLTEDPVVGGRVLAA